MLSLIDIFKLLDETIIKVERQILLIHGINIFIGYKL